MNDPTIMAILFGTAVGFFARFRMLRLDYRQYPSYPQGYTIHLALGAIAAFLGAAAAPAVHEKEFAGVSFLALAATQFREVRGIERETLQNLEESELVPRGKAYIEGIARVFEARNYLAMLSSLVASSAVVIAGALGAPAAIALGAGLITGALAVAFVGRGGRGQVIEDIADVEIVPIEFDGPILTVAGVAMMNIGLEEPRKRYLEEGLAVRITPRGPDAVATLANLGQRQAIAHDASMLVGLTKEVDEPYFTPLVRRHSVTGIVVLAILPAIRDPDALLAAVRRAPILEAAVRRPTESRAGQLLQRKEGRGP